MLPGLGVTEILALGVLALLVVGPKDLPLMMRKIGRWTARLRAMAQEFRTGFDELARQAELDELKREVDALRRANPLNEMRQPLRDLDRDIRSAVSPSPLAAKPPAPALPALPPDPGPAPVALETAPEPEPVPARPAAGGAAS
jgi:sec-independent protein translocase protein TatB